MSFSSFSQTTSEPEGTKLPNIFPPQIEIIFEDTAVCFTKQDARILLVDLVKGGIADSIIVNLENQQAIDDSIIYKQESVISKLEEENGNLVEVNTNQQTVIDNKEIIITNNQEADEIRLEEIKALKKALRKEKVLKWIGFAVGVLGAGFGLGFGLSP